MEFNLSKKILIIEDEEQMRNIMMSKLAEEGYIVFTAENGENGLAEALARRPDLIILDLIMPQMDGITMLRKLREDEDWGKDVPVMIMTNSTNDDKLKEAFDHGVYEYLVKSNWDLTSVMEKVSQVLKSKETA